MRAGFESSNNAIQASVALLHSKDPRSGWPPTALRIGKRLLQRTSGHVGPWRRFSISKHLELGEKVPITLMSTECGMFVFGLFCLCLTAMGVCILAYVGACVDMGLS